MMSAMTSCCATSTSSCCSPSASLRPPSSGLGLGLGRRGRGLLQAKRASSLRVRISTHGTSEPCKEGTNSNKPGPSPPLPPRRPPPPPRTTLKEVLAKVEAAVMPQTEGDAKDAFWIALSIAVLLWASQRVVCAAMHIQHYLHHLDQL
eukprot:jgi/Chlat1/1600/Chrsp124S01864